MEHKTRLLDCTLRDGGFVNDWRFGEDCIIDIFERLELAGIDFIEVGYLRDYVSLDLGVSVYPDTASVGRVVPPITVNSSRMVAIIDYGDCAIDRIGPCSESVLDGIRVTFKRKDLKQAVDFCKQIKEKGYFVSLQPVSFRDYTPQDVLDLVAAANELAPFAVCIVDTYGFMDKRDLLRYFNLMDATLDPNIALGYHSHNNFQLAYSNAVELIEQFTQRDLIVDCSVMGMGKGAGNAATELIANYMNSNMGGQYDVSQVLEIADTYIGQELGPVRWGYSLKYYIAAATYCHHKYVSYLLDKRTLSIKSVLDILSNIAPDKRTSYDEKYIANIYKEYQEHNIDDSAAIDKLRKEIGDRKVLLLAPGRSLVDEAERIEQYISENKPYTISVNHYSSKYPDDAIFVSNNRRYGQISLKAKKYPSAAIIIATSNIHPTMLKPGYVLNFSSILVDDEEISDNATLMMINALVRMGIKEVILAGFDGYVPNGENYFDKNWDFNGKSWRNNQIIKDAVARTSGNIRMRFLTKSKYDEGNG